MNDYGCGVDKGFFFFLCVCAGTNIQTNEEVAIKLVSVYTNEVLYVFEFGCFRFVLYLFPFKA